MARPRKLEVSSNWPKIRPRHRVGGVSFMVDSGLPINGKRVQKVFPTLESAESYAAGLRITHANAGASGFKMDDSGRADAVAALEDLRAAGADVSLRAVVKFWLAHNRPTQGDISLEKLIEAFINNRKRAGLRARSVADLEARTLAFQRHCGGAAPAGLTPERALQWRKDAGGKRDVKTISRDEINAFLQRPGISETMAGNDWTTLHSLFAFAMHPRHYRGRATPRSAPLSGWVAANPIAEIPKPFAKQGAPVLIDFDAAVRLLRAAWQSKDSDKLLAYVVLGLFAGLRPSEIEALEWTDIEFHGQHPVVNIRLSKTKAGVRNLDLPSCAVEWLRLCAEESGPVVESKNFRRRWARLLWAAKIEKWQPDCLRHTFASVDYRIGQDANKTASKLGHARAESVLFGHYRASMPMALAKRFADLLPGTVIPELAGNLIPLTTDAVEKETPAPNAAAEARPAIA